MLHGCKQSPDDFALGTGMNVIAQDMKFHVVYPAQTRFANIVKCWQWFDATSQIRGGGEAALIAGIIDEVAGKVSIDKTRIYVCGLSAGGAMTSILGAEYSDKFAAIGIHSGIAHGAATNMFSAAAAMKYGTVGTLNGQDTFVPTIVFQGDNDTTVNPINAQHIVNQLLGSDNVDKSLVKKTSADPQYIKDYWVGVGGNVQLESWTIIDGPHAWSGGRPGGSYTFPAGPDASREMVRFFMANSKN